MPRITFLPTEQTPHPLVYRFNGDGTMTVRCGCGGWAWDEARCGDFPTPSQARTAAEDDHRRHAAGDGHEDAAGEQGERAELSVQSSRAVVTPPAVPCTRPGTRRGRVAGGGRRR